VGEDEKISSLKQRVTSSKIQKVKKVGAKKKNAERGEPKRKKKFRLKFVLVSWFEKKRAFGCKPRHLRKNHINNSDTTTLNDVWGHRENRRGKGKQGKASW